MKEKKESFVIKYLVTERIERKYINLLKNNEVDKERMVEKYNNLMVVNIKTNCDKRI